MITGLTTMTNILVTGVNGQLGSEIRCLIDHQPSAIDHQRFYFTDRDALDITNKKAIDQFVQNNAIEIIINAAAYTAVDKAEEDENSANKVNYLATRHLAEVAKEHGVKLIYISTDYVFDGKNHTPYNEDDKTNPNSIYGKTKLLGEEAMKEINPKDSIIIRSSWIYSSFGTNFATTMLRLGKERDELGVIFDQVGTPTYARDLAKAILEILPNIHNDTVEIYHYSNEGVSSWYDFAKEIMRMAKIECKVNPIETKEYPTPATRPHYSVLNKSKIKKKFGITIPYWKESLDNCLKVLGEKK